MAHRWIWEQAMTRSVVIGGGISGCVAALRLARAGREVVLLERGPNLGGLVVSFEIGGTPLECFYHHVFPNEREMIGSGPSAPRSTC
jgi:protoporphyrinogen oxidase